MTVVNEVDPTHEASAEAPFALRVRGHDGLALVVDAFEGRERTNEPWRFDLELTRPPGGEALLDAVGRVASFEIRTGVVPRRFTGIVASVRLLGLEPLQGRVRLGVRLVSKLDSLRLRKRSRVFQNLGVDEVVRRVLAEAGIPSRWLLGRAHPAREYCTQYAETDLAFVRRLLAESGIALRHEADVSPTPLDGSHVDTLVFGDDARFGTPLALTHGTTAQPLVWRDAEETRAASLADVGRFEPVRRLRANAASYREYDPENPEARLEASSVADEDAGERFEQEDHEAPFGFRKWGFGQHEPERMLARLRRRARTFTGSGRAPGVAPGATFRLEGHPSEACRGEFVVTRVVHRGRAHRGSDDAPTYENAFECVPSTVLDVPTGKRRPRVLATLTATVVGPPGEAIHCDELGRIKVQFHWDREGRRDEHSSCWIRAMQAWSGEGFGTLYLPRVGMEVVVAFEDGDPDKPLVLGSVYNGTHPTPFRLPDERAKSGLRTRSTPASDGYNELSFDDTRGNERVFLKAERALAIHVGHDHTVDVEHDHGVRIAGAETLEIAKDRSIRVRGARLDETFGGTTTKTLGDAVELVGGERTTEVGGSERRLVAGDALTTVQGRAVTRVKRDHAIATGGAFAVEAGNEKQPAGIDLYAWGASQLGADGPVELRSERAIVLSCGESRIVVGRDSIELHAPRVTVFGGERVSLEAKGPLLSLGEHAELSAATVKLTSSKASLELDEDAHLDGTRVLLACGGAEPGALTDEDGAPLTQPLKLKLLAPDYTPYAQKAFVVKSGGRRYEGTTGAGGELDVEVPLEATTADVVVWLGKRPEGPTRRYAVELAPLESPQTVLGLRQRLRHLGYDARMPTGEFDAIAKSALAWFQRDRGLEATGALDAATVSALGDTHGH
jgi:type VI secretion system secreted protein VgrG